MSASTEYREPKTGFRCMRFGERRVKIRDINDNRAQAQAQKLKPQVRAWGLSLNETGRYSTISFRVAVLLPARRRTK